MYRYLGQLVFTSSGTYHDNLSRAVNSEGAFINNINFRALQRNTQWVEFDDDNKEMIINRDYIEWTIGGGGGGGSANDILKIPRYPITLVGTIQSGTFRIQQPSLSTNSFIWDNLFTGDAGQPGEILQGGFEYRPLLDNISITTGNGGSGGSHGVYGFLQVSPFTSPDRILIEAGAGGDTTLGHNGVTYTAKGGAGGKSHIAKARFWENINGLNGISTLFGEGGKSIVSTARMTTNEIARLPSIRSATGCCSSGASASYRQNAVRGTNAVINNGASDGGLGAPGLVVLRFYKRRIYKV